MTIAHHGQTKEAPLPLPASARAPHSEELPRLPGSCELLSPRDRSVRAQQLAERGYLIARVVAVFEDEQRDEDTRPSMHGGPLRRGSLREALDGAVEISLALRGALPPSVDVDAPPVAMAHDQLFRVRTLEAAGLCLVLPGLRKLAGDGGLCSADSEALAVWKTLAETQPVVLLLDEGDCDVSMLAPTTLGEVFGYPNGRPAGWPDDARAAGSAPCLSAPSLDSLAEAAVDDGEAHDEAHDEELDAPSRDALSLHALPVFVSAPSMEAVEPKPRREDGRVMPHDPLQGIDEIEDEDAFAPLDSAPLQASLFERVDQDVHDAVKRFSQPPPPPPPRSVMPQSMVQSYCDELDEASGPRPVKVIEELFVTRYTPLCEALARGLKDDVARAVVEDWRSAFEKSYSEGFNTMKLTGKRPAMVLDAPEIATRIARLNGARTVQLLLVDAMRYDLGQRVLRDLKTRLSDTAVCVEETLMWSALPSVTPTQMQLLSRGPRGLRENATPSEREGNVQRHGSVTTLRRVRIGQRDLVKLDVVEARLRDAGEGFDERLDAIATEVSEVIAHFSESLPPRSLLFVFGDHGFKLPLVRGGTTGPAEQGGATPEEVLIGGQAWLVGDVH